MATPKAPREERKDETRLRAEQRKLALKQRRQENRRAIEGGAKVASVYK